MIKFRAHHFLCAFCFQGKGYSPKFIKNFSSIMATLNTPNGDDEQITITAHTDDICQPCPHKRGLACESETKVQQLDANHREAFALENETAITWGDFKNRLNSTLTLQTFDQICAACEWKASGICEGILQASGIK